MEEFASLIPIIIIAVFTAIAGSAKNKQKHSEQQTSGWQQTASASASSSASRPTPAAQPVSMASMLPQQPHTVAQPMVHAHLDPACDVHDSSAYGSLNTVSPEGKDFCHEDQLPQHRAPIQEAVAEHPGLTLDLSGESMVRAFVMQEILTRPADRRRR